MQAVNCVFDSCSAKYANRQSLKFPVEVKSHMENFNIVWQYKDLLLKGLGYTIFVSVAAILIAICIGMLLSVLRMGGDSLLSRIIKKIVGVYISFVRGTPVLVQIYIIYQALAIMGLNLSNLVSGIIALSLNSGGFIAEIIRGGLIAIPKGQTEAARSLGMSEPKILIRIVFPQVFKVVLPQLTSEFINVIKVSPMLSVLAIVELTRTAQRLVSQTYINLPFYVAIAILYFVICAGLEELVKLQKKKLNKNS